MEKYYVDYKCYLGDKRRCAVFGREKDGKIEIFVLKTNKEDHFEKIIAERAYKKYLSGKPLEYTQATTIKWEDEGKKYKVVYYSTESYHPEIFTIPIEEEHSIQWQFSQFCVKNFYKRAVRLERAIIVRDMLYRQDGSSINYTKPKVNGSKMSS